MNNMSVSHIYNRPIDGDIVTENNQQQALFNVEKKAHDYDSSCSSCKSH